MTNILATNHTGLHQITNSTVYINPKPYKTIYLVIYPSTADVKI
jgi:hypothetical protein